MLMAKDPDDSPNTSRELTDISAPKMDPLDPASLPRELPVTASDADKEPNSMELS